MPRAMHLPRSSDRRSAPVGAGRSAPPALQRATRQRDAIRRVLRQCARAPRSSRQSVRDRPHPPVPRRAAPTRGQAHRGTRRAALGVRRLRSAWGHPLGDPRADRAASHRRRPQAPTRTRTTGSADRTRTSDRADHRGRRHQPRSRRRAVSLTQDDRVPPRPDLSQARRPYPDRARRNRGPARLARSSFAIRARGPGLGISPARRPRDGGSIPVVPTAAMQQAGIE
jgi:hypothetical protein